jgi:hypothetical protein
VFGIDLNGRLALVPAFFLNGEVKVDSMVLSSPNLFLPLSDDWVRACLRESNPPMGDPVNRNEASRLRRQVDVRSFMDPAYSNLKSGATKVTHPTIAKQFARLMTGFYKTASDRTCLKTVIEEGGVPFAAAFRKVAAKFPQIRAMVDRVYGQGTADAMLQDSLIKYAAIGQLEKLPPPTPVPPPAPVPSPPGVQREQLPMPTPVTEPKSRYDRYLQGARQLYDQYTPEWLTPGRLALGLGGAVAVGAGLGYTQRKKKKKEVLKDMTAEMIAKGAAQSRGGPLTKLLESKAPQRTKSDDRDGKEDGVGDIAVVTPQSAQRAYAAGVPIGPKNTREMIKKGYCVIDNRKEASFSFKERDISNMKFQSPSSPGFYQVMTDKGAKRLLVLMPQNCPGSCLVVDTNTKDWILTNTGNVAIRPDGDLDTTDGYLSWISDRPVVKNFKASSDYSTAAVLFSDDGHSWGPLNLDTTAYDDGPRSSGETSKRAPFQQQQPLRLSWRNDARTSSQFPGSFGKSCSDPCANTTISIRHGAPGSRPTVSGTVLSVPGGTRVFEMDGKQLKLMTPFEVQDQIKSAAVRLDVVSQGPDVLLNRRKIARELAPLALVCEWDLRESDAERVVNEPGTYLVIPPAWVRSSVKSAAENDLTDTESVVPPMEDPEQGTFSTRRYSFPEQAMRPATAQQVQMPNSPPRAWDGDAAEDEQLDAVGRAQDAANMGSNGEKGLFSVAGLTAMLDEVDGAESASRGTSHLIRAIDQLGRDLFMARWHQDAFDQRYGTSDRMQLENLIRANFQQLGKTVLRLNQNGIQQHIDPMLTNSEVEDN